MRIALTPEQKATIFDKIEEWLLDGATIRAHSDGSAFFATDDGRVHIENLVIAFVDKKPAKGDQK